MKFENILNISYVTLLCISVVCLFYEDPLYYFICLVILTNINILNVSHYTKKIKERVNKLENDKSYKYRWINNKRLK